MWIDDARPNSRDAHTPGPTETGLAMATAYELGDAIDTLHSPLRGGDAYRDLDPVLLAAARTAADAEHLAAAVEYTLTTPTAEVVDLATRRRARPPLELRAA